MPQNFNSTSGGAKSTRSEMTGKEIKKGRTFWRLYSTLFLVAVAAAIIIGVSFVSEKKERPLLAPVQPKAIETNTITEALPEPAAETTPPTSLELQNNKPDINQKNPPSPITVSNIYQDESGVWRNRPSVVADASKAEFYQDEKGIWRNRQVPQKKGRAIKPNHFDGDSPNLLSQLTNNKNNSKNVASNATETTSGLSEIINLISSLSGGDTLLNSSFVQESLGNIGGLDALLSNDNDGLLSLFNIYDNLLENINGEEFGHIEQPRANTISSAPALWRRSQPAEKNYPGISLDGYEYFDPDKAGEIESEWEYFTSDHIKTRSSAKHF